MSDDCSASEGLHPSGQPHFRREEGIEGIHPDYEADLDRALDFLDGVDDIGDLLGDDDEDDGQGDIGIEPPSVGPQDGSDMAMAQELVEEARGELEVGEVIAAALAAAPLEPATAATVQVEFV